MGGISFRSLIFMILIAVLVWCSSIETCIARGGKHWRQSRYASAASLSKKKGASHGHSHSHRNYHKGGSKPKAPPQSHKATPSPLPSPKPKEEIIPSPSPLQKGYGSGQQSSIFNVLDFGANGDGKTDDTKLDGTIIAPTDAQPWGKGLFQWLEFSKLRGITIQGKGIIDGRGSGWWQDASYEEPYDDEIKLIIPLNNTVQERPPMPVTNELNGKMPSIKPTSLRFYGIFNVTVTGITIQNSPQCHLKFDNCMGVVVHDITVSSPGDSPNTDGIHLQNSNEVQIHSSTLGCGDDCVSIQTGCSNVYIHNVNCGPGHGISIGSLGKDNTKACVSNITFRDISMHNTMNGVRIKTWQGGSGSVQGVLFSNIQVSDIQLPIVIDQFYCDKRTCSNETAAVALSGITYEKIRGTYTVKPVHFACSDSLPCIGVTLFGIQLKPQQERYHLYNPFCWQTFGELTTPTVPPIGCLHIGKPTNNRVQSDHDVC